MHPITAFEFWLGMGLLVAGLAALAAGYCLHMRAILQDIAAEDAAEMAEEMFAEYVDNARYCVHFVEVISIETDGWGEADEDDAP